MVWYKHRPLTQFPLWGITGWHLGYLTWASPPRSVLLTDTSCAFPHHPTRSSKLFNYLLQNPFRVRMQPPSSVSTHCTQRSPKNPQRPTKCGYSASPEIREHILSNQYSHDLVILSHELTLWRLFFTINVLN